MASISDNHVNPASGASEQNYTAAEAAPVIRSEHSEASLTRMVEHHAAKIPSHVFLFASFCAMGVAFSSELTGRNHVSRFVGMWVAPLLIMGVYNKLVKNFGLH